MKKLINFLGMTVGGTIGWWLGDLVSLFTAYILSVVGTGLGLWLAHRYTSGQL